MKKVAKVKVLQQRVVQQNKTIETDVEVNGVVTRRRYVVPKNFSPEQTVVFISDSLRNEKERGLIPPFEVEL